MNHIQKTSKWPIRSWQWMLIDSALSIVAQWNIHKEKPLELIQRAHWCKSSLKDELNRNRANSASGHWVALKLSLWWEDPLSGGREEEHTGNCSLPRGYCRASPLSGTRAPLLTGLDWDWSFWKQAHHYHSPTFPTHFRWEVHFHFRFRCLHTKRHQQSNNFQLGKEN